MHATYRNSTCIHAWNDFGAMVCRRSRDICFYFREVLILARLSSLVKDDVVVPIDRMVLSVYLSSWNNCGIYSRLCFNGFE
jgi:hypothetical protein